MGSRVYARSPLPQPFRLPSRQRKPARGDRARWGTCHFFHLAKSWAWVLIFVMVAVARAEARPGDQKNCREQVAVQQLLRQAEDTMRSYEDRRAAYEGAARVCSHEASIYAALSALLLEHQDAQAALTWARRGLEIAPADQDLTVYEGMSLLLVGHPDQALAVLKTAPSTGKNEFYLAMAYRALRQHKEAQQAFLRAFALGFNDPYVLYVLIEQDHALGEKEAGLRDFRTFYEHFPDSPWLHMLYGDAYMSKHDDANAETEYEQAVKLAPDLPIVEYQLGYIDFERAKYAAAEGHFRKEIATNPTLAVAYLYLGATLRRLARNSEALPFLEQAVMRDPNYTLAYNELATGQIEAGKLEDAFGTLQKGESRFPQEAAFPAQLAGLLKRLGRPVEAKSEAEKAARLSNTNNPIQHGLAFVPDIPSTPPNENMQVADVQPSSPAPPHGSPNESTAHAAGAGAGPASLNDSLPTASSIENPELKPLAECLDRSDVNCANQALALIEGPIRDSGECLELEARKFALERRKDDALEAIQRALEKEPNRYSYLMTEGQIYQSFNDQVSAIREFLLADKAHPYVSDTFYFLGMSFFFTEDYPRAEKHFIQSLELDPQNHRAVFMAGVSKMITFKLPEGKAYFEEALKLQPDNPFYHLHYGTLLGRMGDNDSAIDQIQIAERLDPTYALTHFNLGRLFREKGNYPAAMQELETAVKLQPGLPEAYYELGSVYHHLGMEEKSRNAYQEFQTTKDAVRQLGLNPMESNILQHEP